MRKLLLFATILALCVGTVAALQITSPTLGSSNAERDSNVSATFTITNDGTSILFGFIVSSSAATKYHVTFENVPQSLGPGSSATITIKGLIPKDFDAGKRNIGSITVAATPASSSTNNNTTNNTNPFTSHNFTPDTQSPQAVTIPVGMSATSDCGQNTPNVGNMPVIGQWHAGSCDWNTDIEVNQPFQDTIDAGWARIHSNDSNAYWVNPVEYDEGGQTQSPPNNWLYGGKIHTGPGAIDGNIELAGGDSGWIGFYTDPQADGQLVLYIAENDCGGAVQQVPVEGIIIGKVSTGPGLCDGLPEGFSETGDSVDSGAMYVVYLPIDHTPVTTSAIGAFESLNETSLSGWAFDSDSQASNVHVFIDGIFWKDITATETRQDLVGTIPDANHGFSYTFTQADLDSFNTSVDHTFNLYAIDLPEGTSILLNGSPKVLVGIPVNTSNTSNNTTNTTNNSTNNNTTNSTNNNTSNTTNNNTNNNNGNPNASTTVTTNLHMQAENNLEIERVRINCNDLQTVQDGDTVDDVSPGDRCTLTVKVKNHGDIDIRNVDIDVDTSNNDIDGDRTDISTLYSKDREERDLELRVDDDADARRITIDVKVDGIDEDGAKHSDEMQFTIKIERLSHDLQISRIIVTPEEAERCEVSRVDVRVYVENKGERDEDKVAIELRVPSLNFDKKIKDINIDKDEEEYVTFSVPVDSSTPFGSFTATAKSFFENYGESDRRSETIVILKCTDSDTHNFESTTNRQNDNSGTQLSETTTNQVVAPPPAVPQDQLIIIPPAQQNTTSTFWSGVLFTALLVIFNLAALSILGVMGYGYSKKKSVPKAQETPKESEATEVEINEYY